MNWFPPCSKWCNFSSSKCDTKNVLPAPMNNKCFFSKIRSKILSNSSSLYSNCFHQSFNHNLFPMECPGISRDPFLRQRIGPRSKSQAMEFCWAKIPRSIRWKVSRNLHASGRDVVWVSSKKSTKQCAVYGISQKKDVGTFTHTCGYLQNININLRCWSIQLSHIMSYIHLDNH